MELSFSKTESKIKESQGDGDIPVKGKDPGVRIIPRGDVAWLELDLPGQKVNKFSSYVVIELERLIRQLKSSSYKAVVFISRKKSIFIAGADIEEIKNLHKYEEYEEVISFGQGVLNSIEDLPMPTIAAINGACMGGGCELALACDYRIVTDDPSTKVGLPEVRLGLLPGWGGCIRLPKLVGLQSSLDIILAGKSVIGKKALKIGLADECVPKELLDEKVQLFIEEILSGRRKKKVFRPRGFMNKFLESPLGKVVDLESI